MRTSDRYDVRRRVSRTRRRNAAVIGVVLIVASGCSTARDRVADDAEEQLEQQLDPSGERDLDVQVDPDSSIVRVNDQESGDVFVSGAGQERPTFLDDTIPLPDDLEITWSAVQQGITKVEGELPADSVAELRRMYVEAAERAGWAIEDDQQSLLGEEVVLLAYLPDDAPLDVRVDDTTFTLYVGRFWENPPTIDR